MIETIDARLVEWVQSVVGPVTVSLEPPLTGSDEESVSVYLLELVRLPPPRGQERPPLQLALRYLVTVRADGPERAHHLLGELVLAALEQVDLTVQLEPPSAGMWSALGVVPQPCFVLQVPLRRERAQPDLKLVRQPLIVRASPITSLRGVLLGPGDVPLAGARVELGRLQLGVRADRKGRFHFETIPADSVGQWLIVKVKGREFRVDLEGPIADGEPVVIRLDLAE
jgi:hypothetical protein